MEGQEGQEQREGQGGKGRQGRPIEYSGNATVYVFGKFWLWRSLVMSVHGHGKPEFVQI